MNTQTTDSRSRKKHYGWWISIIVIGTIAALQTAVIIDVAIRGR
jgi:hypothetical protein